jgi:hypothetical protein
MSSRSGRGILGKRTCSNESGVTSSATSGSTAPTAGPACSTKARVLFF